MNRTDLLWIVGAVVATVIVLYFLLVATRPLTGIALGFLTMAFAAVLARWLQ